MTDSDTAGRLNYQREGFDVSWDEHGLVIRVVDYHAGSLNLPWETILDLAQRAGAGIPSVPVKRGKKIRKCLD
jgi:hypothetical protein